MPIDKALNRGYVLSPLAAPHRRREGQVLCWPSDKGKAYTGPLPAAVEALQGPMGSRASAGANA